MPEFECLEKTTFASDLTTLFAMAKSPPQRNTGLARDWQRQRGENLPTIMDHSFNRQSPASGEPTDEQLMERIRKAAERRQDVAGGRRKRLATMLLPAGTGADRLYPPLVPLLAYGRGALAAIRGRRRAML